MSPEEAWEVVIERSLYVMPPARVGVQEWYVTDDCRTSHGFGPSPIAAIKDFVAKLASAPAADDLSFLE